MKATLTLTRAWTGTFLVAAGIWVAPCFGQSVPGSTMNAPIIMTGVDRRPSIYVFEW